MVGNGAVDVDEVDGGIFEDLLEAGISLVDAEFIADFVELGFVATTDGRDVAEGVVLVDGDEFGAEA